MPPPNPAQPPSPASGDPEARPLAELASDLARDAARLFRQEVALARTELGRTARILARGAGWLVGGGVTAAAGALSLAAFLVVLLGSLIGSYWLAALIVGVVLILAGGALAYAGARRLREDRVAPEATMASLQETGRWAQAEAAEVRATLRGNGAGGGGGHESSAVRRSPPPPADGRAAGGGATPAAPDQRRRGSPHGDSPGNGSSGEREGKKGLLKRVWSEFQEDDLTNQAAGLAYFAFLSFPPALLVLFSLTGFFGGEEVADWLTQQMENVLPEEAGALVETFVQNVVHQEAPGAFSVGLLLALWAASNIFMALSRGLDTAYDVKEERSWVKQRAIAVGVMLLVVVFFLAGSALLLSGPQIAGALDLWGAAEVAWTVVSWVIPPVLIIGAFWICYYVLPARDQARHKVEILKGAAVAAVLWFLATIAFRFYIINFGSYTETYGFIGAIIVLLLWLFITGLVSLVGGELASELEHSATE